MTRRFFAQKASGFLAGVGALLGVKTAGAERLSTPMVVSGYWNIPTKSSEGEPTPGTRVRIIRISDRFMFDTDDMGLMYEVIYPNGNAVQKMVVWNRYSVTPIELDLS